jgi:hypothetical protein
MTKQYFFNSSTDDFTELLNDKTLKKFFGHKLKYNNHICIEFVNNFSDKEDGYLLLKYGDMIVDPITDFSPIPNVDYIVKRN